jgi:hypothetical protein
MFVQHVFPTSYDDIQRWYDQSISDGETDEDAFTCSPTGKGQSYYFFGVKVFEFIPGEIGKSRLKLRDELLRPLGITREDPDPMSFYTIADLSADQMAVLADLLRSQKRKIFRNTITESFSCCNDFMACSEAGHCIHPEDRFYNGCYYRTNLDQGKIFYGPRRNVKGA